MCESESQGIERGARGHYLQRLDTLRDKEIADPQGKAMARGVICALDKGILLEGDFSQRDIDILVLRDALRS